jgi:hypothetical protein
MIYYIQAPPPPEPRQPQWLHACLGYQHPPTIGETALKCNLTSSTLLGLIQPSVTPYGTPREVAAMGARCRVD